MVTGAATPVAEQSQRMTSTLLRYFIAASLGATALASMPDAAVHAQSSAAEALKKAKVLERLAEGAPASTVGRCARLCRRSGVAETAAQ